MVTGQIDTCINDLSFVGFPGQMIYVMVFSAKKQLKVTKSSNAIQNFRITAKVLKFLGVICRFMYFLEK